MTEPKRLLDEVDSQLARELLNAGRWSPGPSGVRRQRVLTALGVGLAVGTTNKLSFAAMSTWSKVATIGCVVSAGAGSLFVYRSVTNHATTVASYESDMHSAVGQALEPAVVPGFQPSTQVLEEDTSARPLPTGKARPSGESPVAAPEQLDAPTRLSPRANVKPERKDSRVRDELTLLEQARSELRSGRPEGAVATLSSYRQRFPQGVLALEAEVLRIEALAAAGKTTEAAKRAQRVLARHPNSVVASRLKRFEAP